MSICRRERWNVFHHISVNVVPMRNFTVVVADFVADDEVRMAVLSY